MKTSRRAGSVAVACLAAAGIALVASTPGSAAEAAGAAGEPPRGTDGGVPPDDPSSQRLIFRKHSVDAFDAGLPWYWLVFGFAAQAMFTGRFMVQWIASERAKRSVVPVSFWIFSLLGSMGLLAYFLRRGDPVAIVGQLPNSLIYIRNLVLIRRSARAGEAGS